MEYTTQLDAAKKKIITKEMKRVAQKENIDVEILREKLQKDTWLFLQTKTTNH